VSFQGREETPRLGFSRQNEGRELIEDMIEDVEAERRENGVLDCQRRGELSLKRSVTEDSAE